MDNTKRTRGTKASYKKKKLADKEERMTSGVTGVVVLPESISVSDLSEKILISSAEIIKILMSYGIMANINQTIDFETASVVCEELNITVELEEEENIYDKMLEQHYADEGKLVTRPPIITVMGHVDHGKTSLLDYLRHTNVISGEAGGITQHVGAYTVKAKDKAITFIDTPGHEAFTAMRSRGASVTDIAVLVIAADDGIKPQTVEAISHAKAAKVPIVVAINKIDKPEANPEKVKQELTEYQLVPEDWGGETICVNISAKTGEGIDKLLEMILLVAEVEDLKANMDQPAIGTVIEARIDKLRGITATLLVKSGVLREGDIIVSGTIYGKVRTLVNDKGTKIVKLGPSMAAEMTGLSEVPSAGDKFYVVENEKDAKTITERKKDRIRLLASRSASKMSLDDLFNQMAQSEAKQVELIVKADVQGSLEAVTQALEKLNDNEDGIKVSVIHSGVGAVSESDVLLASASKTVILAFNVKTDNAARLAAAKEEIDIRTYEVIYDLLDEIKDAMKGMKDPEYREVVTGEAEVRQVFKVPSIGAVAGCYVTNGTVKRSESVRVLRDGKVIHTGRLNSLKRFKDDVKEVATGYECGIGIEKFNDIAEGDKLEFFKNEEIKE
jgi:translation initiation factor IF-2